MIEAVTIWMQPLTLPDAAVDPGRGGASHTIEGRVMRIAPGVVDLIPGVWRCVYPLQDGDDPATVIRAVMVGASVIPDEGTP